VLGCVCEILDDWIYWHLTHTIRDYEQYSTIADLHTSQFTVTHTLGFSVFTSCALATDSYQSHCNFKSHMKSSLHSLIPFLPSYPRRLASQNSTLFYAATASFETLLYNHFAWTTQKTQLLYRWVGAFTASQHSNESYSIVTCIFVTVEMCLPSRCLPMKVCLFWLHYSGFQMSCHNIFIKVLLNTSN
jgi:hypothetical protein